MDTIQDDTKFSDSGMDCLKIVYNLQHCERSIAILKQFGLTIRNVVWSDCDRSMTSDGSGGFVKSIWGRNIVDQWFVVTDEDGEEWSLPIIRIGTNLNDPITSFPLAQFKMHFRDPSNREELTQFPFIEILDHLEDFITNRPETVEWDLLNGANNDKSIFGIQYTILPIDPSGLTEFFIKVRTYGTDMLYFIITDGEPSVAFVSGSNHETKLFLNKNDIRAIFTAEAVETARARDLSGIQGKANSFEDLTAKELSKQQVVLIGVPVQEPEEHDFSKSLSLNLLTDECMGSCIPESDIVTRGIGFDMAQLGARVIGGDYDKIPSILKRVPGSNFRIQVMFYATANMTMEMSMTTEIVSAINKQFTTAIGKVLSLGGLSTDIFEYSLQNAYDQKLWRPEMPKLTSPESHITYTPNATRILDTPGIVSAALSFV